MIELIKGVSKKIVEINYTNDDYIEKAIFIINPKKSDLPEQVLKAQAKEYLKKVSPKRKKKKLSLKPRGALIAAGIGAVVLCAVLIIFL